MLQRVTNSDHLRRTWPHLVNADTGATLELGPGESANVDLPDEFADAHLSVGAPQEPPARARQARPKPPKPNTASPAPEPPAEPVTENPQPPVDPAATEE